ncbi:MAG: hypothetical protein GW748_05195 [Alphaproteobacteria bacterium]|nr:hypothetical protein [Alphaproteobacteria bacterium]NCQ67122.1 hypothetical protein [Alphaproteobacteria bacterium]NCT07719.1 hypothetical protein [Alphaproteobacteria bacterium]
MKKLTTYFVISVLSLCGQPLFGSKMSDMISHLGNASNFNAAGSFRDQSTGHYTAGGMMVRQRNRTINPLNIRLPQMGMSCGDFDMRFGGISFIQTDQLVDTLKATAQGVPAYALQLALKTTCPQCEGTMRSIQKVLEDMNALLLGDCHSRQQMLEAVIPTGTAMHEKVCEDITKSGGGNHDFFGTRKRCQGKDKVNAKIDEARERYPDLLVGEFNLVWTALKKLPRYENDTELAEMIMSLVGTVISKKEGPLNKENYKVTFIDPKADEDGYLEAYLQGGTTSKLVCDETSKCLSLTNSQHVITPENSLSNLIMKNINSMKSKYLSEEPFSTQELVFLSDSVNLPVYKYIQITASSGAHWPLQKASQYFAFAILLKQFEEVAAEVLQAVSVLESVQFDTTITQEFKKRLELARTRLQQKIATLDGREIWMIDKLIRSKEDEIRANYDLEGTI